MTVNEIFRLYGKEYLEKFAPNILPSHRKAINDMARCRTAKMGTVHWHCNKCGRDHFSFMPCRNRSCPNCQNNKKLQWVLKQLDMKLPVEYFMATFTIPEYLRAVARANQKIVYNIFFKAAAGAIIKLARDKKYMGGQIGITAILHTWARNLAFHPHVHFLIPAVAISADKKKILFSKGHYLLYAKALSLIFRALFIKLLKKSLLANITCKPAFEKDWVVDLRSVGSGQKAIEYVARYVFKTAVSNSNIISCKDGQVTFKYKNYASKKMVRQTLPVMLFIRMFLQHVLPRGFQKVRYYGFMHPKNRLIYNRVRLLLRAKFKVPARYLDYQHGIKCPSCRADILLVEILRRRPP